jgi:hypothetical protein
VLRLCWFANAFVIRCSILLIWSNERTWNQLKTSCLCSCVLQWCIQSPNWRFGLVWCIHYRHLCICWFDVVLLLNIWAWSCLLPRVFFQAIRKIYHLDWLHIALRSCCINAMSVFSKPYVKNTSINFILHDIWVQSLCHEYFSKPSIKYTPIDFILHTID